MSGSALEENYVFVANQFAIACNYLLFPTNVGYFYNYFLDLVMLVTMFQLTCNKCFLHPFI